MGMSVRTKDQKLQSYIYNSMVPMHLINFCQNPPNNQFLNYTFITIKELAENPNYVDKFIQNGAIEMICSGNWYKPNQFTEDSVVQNGILALVNLLSNASRGITNKQEQAVHAVLQCLHQTSNHPQKKPLLQRLEIALKRAKNNAGTKVKKQRNVRNKNQNNPYNQNNQNNPYQNNQQNYPESTYSSNARGSYNPFPSQQNVMNDNNNNQQQSQYNNNDNGNWNNNNPQNQYGNNNNNNSYGPSQSSFNHQNNNNNFNNNNNPNKKKRNPRNKNMGNNNNNYNNNNMQQQQQYNNNNNYNNNQYNNNNNNQYNNNQQPQKVNYGPTQQQGFNNYGGGNPGGLDYSNAPKGVPKRRVRIKGQRDNIRR